MRRSNSGTLQFGGGNKRCAQGLERFGFQHDIFGYYHNLLWMLETIGRRAEPSTGLSRLEISEIVASACVRDDYPGKRILLIVPDGTRTAPVGALFQTLHQQLAEVTKSFDVLIALGTHQPMSEEGICRRLEISGTERREVYGRVKFFNHSWNNPGALKQIGILSSK